MRVCRYLLASAGLQWVVVVLVTMIVLQVARTGIDAYVALWSAAGHGEGGNAQTLSSAQRPPHAAAQQVSGMAGEHVYEDISPRSVLISATSALAQRWCSAWQYTSGPASDEATAAFLQWLGLLTAAATLATAARAFSFAYSGLRCARKIHLDLLHGCVWLKPFAYSAVVYAAE